MTPFALQQTVCDYLWSRDPEWVAHATPDEVGHELIGHARYARGGGNDWPRVREQLMHIAPSVVEFAKAVVQ